MYYIDYGHSDGNDDNPFISPCYYTVDHEPADSSVCVSWCRCRPNIPSRPTNMHSLSATLSWFCQCSTDKHQSKCTSTESALSFSLSSRPRPSVRPSCLFPSYLHAPCMFGEIFTICMLILLTTGSQFLFLSDSLSCLQSLQNWDLSHPLIAEILCRVHVLISDGSSVVFMWVPGHVGLAGNSAADSAAEDALFLAVSSLTVTHSDYKSLIRLQTLRQWNYIGTVKLRTSCIRLNQGLM